MNDKLALNFSTIVAFRQKPDEKKGDKIREQKTQKALTEERSDDDAVWLLCRQCRQKIAKADARIAINGAHRHTFANPSGIVFEIGCFSQVRGCSAYGAPSSEFAWFTGYSWQITVCGNCLTHLGWFFSSGPSQSFMGLILDRLTEGLSRAG